MLGFYLISFEVIVIVLFGIFLRTENSVVTNVEYFSQGCCLLLGYTMYTLNYRKFDWSVLTNLLFVTAIVLQWNTLFYAFWVSCLTVTFNATTSIGMLNIMSSVEAVLCVLVTVNQFLPRMSHTQVFLVAIIEVIGFSLNLAVETLGIKAVTCGGGMTIFLFASAFAFCIKLFSFPYQKHAPDNNYFNGTLKLIGVILMVFSWPGFNTMGSLFDTSNVSSTANILPSAFYNTVYCLASSIICSLTIQSFSNRIHIHKFTDAIFNGGIIISACANLIIDPFAALLLGIVSSLLMMLYDRYGEKLLFRGDPEYILAFSIISGLLSAIFAAGRAARSPTLSDNSYKLGGLQVACLFVSLGFGIIFGLITVGFLKLTKGVKESEIGHDQAFWIISSDMMPQYSSDKYYSYMSNRGERELPKELEFSVRNNPTLGNSLIK